MTVSRVRRQLPDVFFFCYRISSSWSDSQCCHRCGARSSIDDITISSLRTHLHPNSLTLVTIVMRSYYRTMEHQKHARRQPRKHRSNDGDVMHDIAPRTVETKSHFSSFLFSHGFSFEWQLLNTIFQDFERIVFALALPRFQILHKKSKRMPEKLLVSECLVVAIAIHPN